MLPSLPAAICIMLKCPAYTFHHSLHSTYLLLASLEVPRVGPDALEQLQVVRVDDLIEAVHLCVVTLRQIRTMLNQQVQRVEVASARCMVRWGPTLYKVRRSYEELHRR